MIYTGTYNEYKFLQVAKDGYDFNRFVKEYEKLIIGKAVGVLSFDGDSLGKIYIDESVIHYYMDHTNTTTLPKRKFTTIKFDNEPKIELRNEIENKPEEKD